MSTSAHTVTHNPASVAARYIALWNETNASRRHGLIVEAFTEQATYIDPMANSAGHDGLDAMIGAVQQQFAGLHFSLHGKQDGHNNLVRFSWALGAEGASPVAIGTDVVVMDPDGRIRSVTGFLDMLAVPA